MGNEAKREYTNKQGGILQGPMMIMCYKLRNIINSTHSTEDFPQINNTFCLTLQSVPIFFFATNNNATISILYMYIFILVIIFL